MCNKQFNMCIENNTPRKLKGGSSYEYDLNLLGE